MKNFIKINKKIKSFNKIINVEGDKSLSIRWALLASQAIGKSRAYKLLKSEDVMNTLSCLKKLGVKINFNSSFCEIHGKGLNSYTYKKKLSLSLWAYKGVVYSNPDSNTKQLKQWVRL